MVDITFPAYFPWLLVVLIVYSISISVSAWRCFQRTRSRSLLFLGGLLVIWPWADAVTVEAWPWFDFAKTAVFLLVLSTWFACLAGSVRERVGHAT